LAADAGAHVPRPPLPPDDEALVARLTGHDECRAALLGAGQSVGERGARRGGGEGSVSLLAELARPGSVTDRDRAHDPVPGSEGEERVAEPDQASGRDHVLQTDTALTVVLDLDPLRGPL